jgi:hypothetical protein
MLALLGFTAAYVFAGDDVVKEQEPKGKTITIRGTLVDTSCYFKEAQKDNEHDGMDTCGKDCLISGVPAGVLAADKLYILIFPSKAFADYVGKVVEIKGEAYGDNLVHPKKAVVIEKGVKRPIKLMGFEMM